MRIGKRLRMLGSRSRPVRRVVLYGKPGCHLCEDALELLGRLARRFPMSVDEVDITSDPQLFRRYDIRIPVMVIEGGEELDAPLTEEIVIRALRKTI